MVFWQPPLDVAKVTVIFFTSPIGAFAPVIEFGAAIALGVFYGRTEAGTLRLFLFPYDIPATVIFELAGAQAVQAVIARRVLF